MPLLIDGHLDLAFNVTASARDLTLELGTLRKRERKREQEALLTLPELRRGGLAVVFATLFTAPRDAVRPPGSTLLNPEKRARRERLTYATPEEAKGLAVAQLDVYERWEAEGRVRIVRSKGDLAHHLELFGGDGKTGLVLLMEGADPIGKPDELPWWLERGVRLIGPAWQRTRYCGGTFAPGPLTELGVELVGVMKAHGVPLDVSHLAEESFWGAVELEPRFVLASHSNARALVLTDRQLTDEMIRAVGERGGMVGLVLGNPFLRAGWTKGEREEVTLDDVRRHAEHVAGLIGWERLGIGSDFDGGFGVQETPVEIGRGADFVKLGEAVPEGARAGFLGENWLRFLQRVLPES